MQTPSPWHGLSREELASFESLRHADPHHVLGAHPADGGVIVRAYMPHVRSVRVVPDDPAVPPRDLERMTESGLWGAFVPDARLPMRYQLETRGFHGEHALARDAYAFAPTLGEIDAHLAAEGTHWKLYEKLGAHPRTVEGTDGVSFAVWAPSAARVSLVGEWNRWDGRRHPMRRVGATGIWELFVPGLPPGTLYKFQVTSQAGAVQLKLDPLAFQAQLRPETAGVVTAPSEHRWQDADWVAARAKRDPLRAPMTMYEVHLGSWMRDAGQGDRWLTYRELAPRLADYCNEMGFTHVELLPVAEHPFDGSWGYQVTGYFAPTSRHGTPDDFRFLVDHLHSKGVGVILDWVPAHFPRDAFALARFDGTALYEHADPRQGEHPDWGTLVFNFGRNEVRNFLLANALFWMDQFHIDGLRVDAVAAMLYLDYSRNAGEWVPNKHGGRENLEAIEFLKELNRLAHGEFPGAVVIAEESTAWPAVSKPLYTGGLGFTFKWNMGWMHDTLAFFQLDPIHRRFHHNKLTFSVMYAWSENYVLPLSHDEVVHMKGSLIGKMPGDRWQKFANLRTLLGYMWCHPGKKLLFMGGEFAQVREWNHDRSLDWHLLEDPMHAGVSAMMRDLNALYTSHEALWEADVDPAGFRWIDANDSDQSVFSFIRFAKDGKRHVVCVLNATPIVRPGYRVGVPDAGTYREAFNSDARVYGGSNVGNQGRAESREQPCHGFAHSMTVTLPPLSIVVFESPPLAPATATATATTTAT